jgi:hypothetical protein
LQFFKPFGLLALQNCEFQGRFPKTEVLGKPQQRDFKPPWGKKQHAWRDTQEFKV